MSLPSLIVVTGPPGAGKTTLADALGRAIRCPVISRDEIKEGLINASEGGLTEAEITRHAFETYFETLRFFAERGVSVIAEAAFQHAKWAEALESLSEISRLRIVVCSLVLGLARQRRIERLADDPLRGYFHPDSTLTDSGPAPDYDAPRLPVPTLIVDTTDGYDPKFTEILQFISKDFRQPGE